MAIEKEPQFNKEEEIEVLKQEIKELEAENQELKASKEAAEKELEKTKKALEKAKNDSIHDKLTGLKSRGFFQEKVEEDISGISAPETEKRKEGFKTLSFLFCDIDHFKEYNDTRGHDAGDAILKKVARILEENIRENDTVCRWGGEEIVISLLGADEKEAFEKAEELRRKVEEETDVSLSIGVGAFEQGIDFDELMKMGDKAMYLAKKEGRNRVKTYSQVLEKEKGEK